jgi:acyl-CoA thioester hydrolase
MQRIKIAIPKTFQFSCFLPVTINAINYGNHMSNDAFFSFAHEARIQWLKTLAYTELNIEGLGLIMIDASIQYLSQVFHGENIRISIAVTENFVNGFTLVYYFEKDTQNGFSKAAIMQSNMLFFDYKTQKIAETPLEFAKMFN